MNFIKKWWNKFEDWMDSDDEEDIPIEELEPPDSGIKRVIWTLVDGFELWAKRKPHSPFIVELLIQIFASFLLMIKLLIAVLLIFGIYYIFARSIDKDFLMLLLCLIAFVPWLGILMNIILIPVFPLSFMDSIFGKRTQIKRMSLTVIRTFSTSPNFFDSNSYLGYIFDKTPYPCKWYYFELENEHKSKASKFHQPPQFYQNKYTPLGKERKFFRFVMTEPKSDMLDKLYHLEPTMEFEVSYLRFSKFLKEIRPIAGYEYAEGVEEILDKINHMYP